MENNLHYSRPRASIDQALAKSLVPLKDMSSEHLAILLNDATTEFLYKGQTLFNRGAIDSCHLYLLYGDLLLEDEQGRETLVKGRSSLTPIAHHNPRRYQATALTDCSILRVESQQLDKLLTWSQVADYLHSIISRDRDMDEDVEWMMQVLHSNLFFKVSPLNVEDIFTRMKVVVVDAGEVIIRQGELGDTCYFIKEGSAEVTRQGATGCETLAKIGQGRCFGEDALVNDAPRNATVTMVSDGVLMALPKQDFYRLLKAPTVPSVSYRSIADEAVLVDVRSDEEYSNGHLGGAVNIPLSLLGIKSRLLRLGITYVCYCDTGRRSQAAAYLLREQGYSVVRLEECEEIFNDLNLADRLEQSSSYVLRDGKSYSAQ